MASTAIIWHERVLVSTMERPVASSDRVSQVNHAAAAKVDPTIAAWPVVVRDFIPNSGEPRMPSDRQQTLLRRNGACRKNSESRDYSIGTSSCFPWQATLVITTQFDFFVFATARRCVLETSRFVWAESEHVIELGTNRAVNNQWTPLPLSNVFVSSGKFMIADPQYRNKCTLHRRCYNFWSELDLANAAWYT